MAYPLEHYLLLIPLGFATGSFGTLIGAGGGFILVPILLLLYPTENPQVITSISLAVVFCNALSGSIAYGRMGRIDFKSGALFAAVTIPGAIGGALLTEQIPRNIFDVILGVLLVLIALAIFIFNPKTGKKNNHPLATGLSRHIVERNGVTHDFSFNPIVGAGFSAASGFISSLLGIGGGIIHVPLLTRLLNFPVHIATATSHFTLAIMALTATIVNVASAFFEHGVFRALFLAFGVVLGAQMGALVSKKIHGRWIIRVLALALAFVGIRLFFKV